MRVHIASPHEVLYSLRYFVHTLKQSQNMLKIIRLPFQSEETEYDPLS